MIDEGNDEIPIDFDFSMLQINDFPNVKIKIDALFSDWLLSSLSDGGQILLNELKLSITNYREASKNFNYTSSSSISSVSGNSLLSSPSSSSSLSSSSNVLNSNSSLSSLDNNNHEISNNPSTVLPAASIYFAPPLSPNRKSPKKRLQSEMMLKIGNEGIGNDSTYDSQGILLAPVPMTKLSSENSKVMEDDESIALATTRRRSNFDTIPVFYVIGEGCVKKSPYIREEDSLMSKLPEIESFFKPFKDGIPVDKFVHVTKRLCNFPSYFNVPFCERIFDLYGSPETSGTNSLSSTMNSSIKSNQSQSISTFGSVNTNHNNNNSNNNNNNNNSINNSNNKITMKIFLQYWKNEMEPYDSHERFFRLIKQPNDNYIQQDDFLPFLHELLRFHPGLDFLDGHEEFQRKYALTVITRIFFKVNTSRTGKLSLREVRKSKLLLDFIHVDEETEINRVKEYFAYEHFYVLYCRFFELDLDKDLKLSRDDLIKYGDHSLSDAIVDRIFQVGQRAFTDGREGFDQTGGMTYPDFIYFMLAEEDKASEQSIKYWFRCCDLDGDGVITPAEMGHFYKTQIHRLTSLGQESIQFRDVLCQMIDMLNPTDANAITLKDFSTPEKRKAGGIIFDVLFNLNKFLRFEMRDPFQEKLRREDGFVCEWDRFAHFEYHRLAAEDDVSSNQQQQQHQQKQYNSYANGNNMNNINVVINGNDVDNDDYNMFSEDDGDVGEISMNNGNHSSAFVLHNNSSNMMDLDSSNNSNSNNNSSSNNNNSSLDVTNRGHRNTTNSNIGSSSNSVGGQKVNSNSVNNNTNTNNFGDWSLDDESDSDDDYQITGRYGIEDNSSNVHTNSNQKGRIGQSQQVHQQQSSSIGSKINNSHTTNKVGGNMNSSNISSSSSSSSNNNSNNNSNSNSNNSNNSNNSFGSKRGK